MNDFELVSKAQLDQKYAYILFQRYEMLIKGFYHQFKRMNNHIGYDLDDYVSESYITLLKCLKNFKPEKITNPNNWGFGLYLKQSLLWNKLATNKSKEKKCYKEKTFSDMNTGYSNDDSFIVSEVIDNLHHHTTGDCTIDQVINSVCIDEFMVSLTPKEKIIVNYFQTLRDKGRCPTYKEVGEKLSVSKQMVSFYVQRIKKKWRNVEKVV